ncbi:myeloid leukemia factor 1-like [Pomacea canaliculata]|uniref:myeloid leukemia factor 1-like n=1 Tax=Pomacea canaliculata TaxID=400727 RepID=UPI000D72CB0A|nr:myeloid leukemia factor 1-like [Pomacea canaliculata]
MLSGSFFDNDPFFADHRQHMNTMFRDFGFPSGGLLGITDGHRQQRHQQPFNQLAPTSMFDFGFSNMFQNMRRMMDDMHNTFEAANKTPNGHVYTQSSFMSYSNVDGTPKVYQASSSTTQAPGGIKETRKVVRDSESGVEKMAVGHHIGERGHVVERRRNRRTGDHEENQEYINLDEEEGQHFDREWQERSKQTMRGLEYRRRRERSDRGRQLSLPAPSTKRSYRERE